MNKVMRETCQECGEFKSCNDDGICFECLQDKADLEDWLPEDGYDDSSEEEDE